MMDLVTAEIDKALRWSRETGGAVLIEQLEDGTVRIVRGPAEIVRNFVDGGDDLDYDG